MTILAQKILNCSVPAIKLSHKSKEQSHHDYTRMKDHDLQRTSNQTISQKQITIAPPAQ